MLPRVRKSLARHPKRSDSKTFSPRLKVDNRRGLVERHVLYYTHLWLMVGSPLPGYTRINGKQAARSHLEGSVVETLKGRKLLPGKINCFQAFKKFEVVIGSQPGINKKIPLYKLCAYEVRKAHIGIRSSFGGELARHVNGSMSRNFKSVPPITKINRCKHHSCVDFHGSLLHRQITNHQRLSQNILPIVSSLCPFEFSPNFRLLKIILIRQVFTASKFWQLYQPHSPSFLYSFEYHSIIYIS